MSWFVWMASQPYFAYWRKIRLVIWKGDVNSKVMKKISRPKDGAWKNLGVFEVCWNIITLFRLQLRYRSMEKQYPPRSHWKQVAFMTSVMWKTECSYKQLTGLAFYHKIVLWLGNTFVAVPIFPFYRIFYLLVREHSWNF